MRGSTVVPAGQGQRKKCNSQKKRMMDKESSRPVYGRPTQYRVPIILVCEIPFKAGLLACPRSNESRKRVTGFPYK